MKTIWVLMLSLTVWQDRAHALPPFPFMSHSFCQGVAKALENKSNTASNESVHDMCSPLSINYSVNPSYYYICLDTALKHVTSPRDAIAFCHSEESKVADASGTKEEDALSKLFVPMPVELDPVLKQAETQTSSKQLDECKSKEFLNKYNECNLANAPVAISLDSISNILNYPMINGGGTFVPTLPVYNEAECKCLDQKVKQDYKLVGPQHLPKDLQTERNRINGLIFNAVGKKFLNNYASNFEDVRFYLTNKFDALGSSPQEADKLLCDDAAAFQSTIDEACTAAGVPKSTSERRTAELLSSLGDDVMGVPTLSGKFRKINEYILNFKDEDSDKTLSRTKYDQIRNGASKKAPEVGFINTLLNEVMADPELSKSFQFELENNRNPGHALSNVITNEAAPEVQNLFKRLIKKNKRSPLFKNIESALKTESLEDFPNLIRNTYKVAFGTHPGLKAILSNTALFNKVMAKTVKSKDSNPNLIDILENDSSLLTEHFQSRCEKIRNNMAQAICTPNEDHIKRVSKDDINKLLTQIDGRINLPLKDLLLCQMPEVEPKGVFNKLAFSYSDTLNRSDYLNRKLNPISKQDNGFSSVYRAMKGGKGNKGLEDLNSIINAFASEKRSSSPAISREITKNEVLASNMIADTSSFTKPVTQARSNVTESLASHEVPSIQTPMALPSSISNNSPSLESKSMRNQLKDYLTDKDNEKDVQKHLSNANDSDLKELLRLKEEIARDKEKIQNILSDSEKNKVKSLEEKYLDLQKQYQEAIKKKAPEATPVALADEYENESSFGGTTANNGTTGGDSGQVNNNSYNSGTSGSTSGGVARSIASSSQGSVSSNSSSSNSAARESTRDEIIVESSGIHSNDIQTSSSTLNQEILSFVNKHEGDITTLQQLKEKGMILKYKVMENGKEVEKQMKVDYTTMSSEIKQAIDKKIAHQKLRHNQFNDLEHEYLKARRAYSYSALKMILGIQSQKTK